MVRTLVSASDTERIAFTSIAAFRGVKARNADYLPEHGQERDPGFVSQLQESL